MEGLTKSWLGSRPSAFVGQKKQQIWMLGGGPIVLLRNRGSPPPPTCAIVGEYDKNSEIDSIALVDEVEEPHRIEPWSRRAQRSAG